MTDMKRQTYPAMHRYLFHQQTTEYALRYCEEVALVKNTNEDASESDLLQNKLDLLQIYCAFKSISSSLVFQFTNQPSPKGLLVVDLPFRHGSELPERYHYDFQFIPRPGIEPRSSEQEVRILASTAPTFFTPIYHQADNVNKISAFFNPRSNLNDKILKLKVCNFLEQSL